MKENIEVNRGPINKRLKNQKKDLYREVKKLRHEFQQFRQNNKYSQKSESETTTQESEKLVGTEKKISQVTPFDSLEKDQTNSIKVKSLQNELKDLKSLFNVNNQFQNYKINSKTVISQLIDEVKQLSLKVQEFEINKKRNELGEIQIRREGTKFLDQWVDGEQFKFFKKEKEQLQQTLSSITDDLLLPYYTSNLQNCEQKLKDLEEQKNFHIKSIKKYQNQIRLNKEQIKFDENYQILDIVSEDGLNTVFRAFDFENLSYVAIKVFKLNPSWTNKQKTMFITMALQETEILKSLKHENFPKYVNQIEIDQNSFGLVMQFCKGINLQDFNLLHKFDYLKATLDEKMKREEQSQSILKKICEAVDHLHQKKIIHLDLKPSNIMMDYDDIKIIDFGVSSYADHIDLAPLRGTYDYQAPECHQQSIKERQGEKIDAWAIGVIYYEMLHGHKKIPFDYAQQVIIDDNLSQKSRLILWKCLQRDCNKRVSINDILKIINNQDSLIDDQGKIV